jgi:hypothetical protein
MNAYAKSLGHLCRWVSMIGHLPDRRDLEFFRVPFSTHVDSFTQNYGLGVSSVLVTVHGAI